jgi:hypothetical protein
MERGVIDPCAVFFFFVLALLLALAMLSTSLHTQSIIIYFTWRRVGSLPIFSPGGGGEKQHVAMSALIQSPGGKSRMLWSPLLRHNYTGST